MPYRVDISEPTPDALDLLIQLGALDVEPLNDGIAAILPDGITPDTVIRSLGVSSVSVSPAIGRDNDSVWLLNPRGISIGGLRIASGETAAPAKVLRLMDSTAFGTGHHPTTALCIEALEEILAVERLDSVLDVGTGSGILALAALMMGVSRAVGLDVDADALKAAAENARLNQLEDRLELILGGPEVVAGKWPLIVANVLAGPLMAMAPTLVQRLAKRGHLILSGIPCSLELEVRRAYEHFGVRHVRSNARSGWTILMAQAPW
jgi:ribosomal protein L11 methylase PrmA